jgi:hypothetical protein
VLAAVTVFAAGAPIVVNTYYSDTGELIATAERETRAVWAGNVLLVTKWQDHREASAGTAEAHLDKDYSTLTWKLTADTGETDYSGKRDGDTVSMTDTLRGESVDRSKDVGKRAFSHNPAISLEGFVRSGAGKIEFYTVPPDDMSFHKMKAEGKGVEQITFGGSSVSAVRVDWGLTGLRSAFYKRTFWFREADGVFLRSDPSRGIYSELGAG